MKADRPHAQSTSSAKDDISGASGGMAYVSRKSLMDLLTYNPDTGEFFWKQSRGGRKAGEVAGHTSRRGYVLIGIGDQLITAHRIAWCIYYGEFPPRGRFIDHINLNKSDNRIYNLRLATRSENTANTRVHADSKSQIKGVRFRGNKWQARICVHGKEICLGTYASIEAAKTAYDESAKSLFGQFARSYEA